MRTATVSIRPNIGSDLEYDVGFFRIPNDFESASLCKFVVTAIGNLCIV
jgi:hypothetical protein